MKSWYGKIVIRQIQNRPIPGATEKGGEILSPLQENAVRFVHYPDCQQLIIWLPVHGMEYAGLRVKNSLTGEVLEEFPVDEIRSGSVQLLWDTLSLGPGQYRLEIEHRDAGCHVIDFIKYKEGAEPPAPLQAQAKEETCNKPVVYRDGFGNIIKDDDLQLRETVLKEIAAKFSRHIIYENSGRSGRVIYVEGETRIPFYYEIGGGECVAYIEIPSAEQWEVVTQTPLARREDIIQFMAASVHARQAPHCRIEIGDCSVAYFRK